MICENCEIDYPLGLVNLFQGFDARERPTGVIKNLCGQCALEEGNKHSGSQRTCFTGVIAESVRQATLRYREKLK